METNPQKDDNSKSPPPNSLSSRMEVQTEVDQEAIKANEEVEVVFHPQSKSVCMNLIGYPQFSHLFVPEENKSFSSAKLVELGIYSPQTRERIVSSFKMLENQGKLVSSDVNTSTNSKHGNDDLYYNFPDDFVWVEKLVDPLAVEIPRRKFVVTNHPLEVFPSRVLRPIPAAIFSVETLKSSIVGSSEELNFTIQLLDEHKREILAPKLTNPESCLEVCNGNRDCLVIFENVVINEITSLQYYQAWKPFYFRISNNLKLSFTSPPFYISSHASYFQQIIVAKITEAIYFKETKKLKIIGTFVSHPTATWKVLIGYSEQEIPPECLGHQVIEISMETAEPVQLALCINERNSGIKYSNKVMIQIHQHSDHSSLDSPISPNSTLDVGFGYSPIIWKSALGDKTGVEELLNIGYDINTRDQAGRTPLIWAIRSGHIETVKLLVQRDPDVHIRDKLGFSCMHYAVSSGSTDIVYILIQKAVPVNVNSIFKDTPLHYAAAGGYVIIVCKLVLAGAIIVDNVDFQNPLHWATKIKHFEIAEYLWGHSPLGQKLAPYLSWRIMIGTPGAFQESDFMASSLNSETLPTPLSRITLELEQIPSIRDIPMNQKMEFFLKKLIQCRATFNNSKPEFAFKSKRIKRGTLTELVAFIPIINTTIPEIIYAEFFHTIAKNLFRALPARHMPVGVIYHPEEDEPILVSDWNYVELVYKMLNSFFLNPHFDTKIASHFMDHKFLTQLLSQINTEDHREREQIKTTLHRMYAMFFCVRIPLRNEIKNTFCSYIFMGEHHNGIAELLEIVGSFVAGFSSPLKPEHIRYLTESLLPLYRGHLYSTYHSQLTFCVKTFLEKDLTLINLVFETLNRCWPVGDSQKEILFILEVESLLSLYAKKTLAFQTSFIRMVKRIASCITSYHQQIAYKAVYIFNDSEVLQLVVTHVQLFLPLLFDSLRKSESHWHISVRGPCSQLLVLFEKVEPTVYQELKRRPGSPTSPTEENK